jgi:hypothetical protein
LLNGAAFDGWMQAYGRASEENDPQASAELFAPEALYYESPFSEPLAGREAIFLYWKNGAHNLTEKKTGYQILAVSGSLGIARWQSEFVVVSTGERVCLDCVFLVEFNAKGECCLFREWWHRSPNQSRPPQPGRASR